MAEGCFSQINEITCFLHVLSLILIFDDFSKLIKPIHFITLDRRDPLFIVFSSRTLRGTYELLTQENPLQKRRIGFTSVYHQNRGIHLYFSLEIRNIL